MYHTPSRGYYERDRNIQGVAEKRKKGIGLKESD